jgi:predicted esterase
MSAVEVVDADTADSMRVIVAKLKEQDGCLLSFRGSENVVNWVRNFEAWSEDIQSEFPACKGCSLHHGFKTVWDSAKDKVITALGKVGCSTKTSQNLLYLTGHSLGAAVTHIAMFELQVKGFVVAKTYSFEAPRVGNAEFAEAFASFFSKKIPVFRITHHEDPVVHVPMMDLGYRHVFSAEIFYDGDQLGKYTQCNHTEHNYNTTRCSDKYWNIPDMLANHIDEHCHSPLVANGDICNPQCSRSTQSVAEVVVV